MKDERSSGLLARRSRWPRDERNWRAIEIIARGSFCLLFSPSPPPPVSSPSLLRLRRYGAVGSANRILLRYSRFEGIVFCLGFRGMERWDI